MSQTLLTEETYNQKDPLFISPSKEADIKYLKKNPSYPGKRVQGNSLSQESTVSML